MEDHCTLQYACSDKWKNYDAPFTYSLVVGSLHLNDSCSIADHKTVAQYTWYYVKGMRNMKPNTCTPITMLS